MVTVIGIDPHKATHMATAVDDNGKLLGRLEVKARKVGHVELLAWARRSFPGERRWAVEDERNMAGLLLRDLLAAGERVVTVPAYLAADYRKGNRKRGKSDELDATAVARTALREPLPEFVLDEASREIKLLNDHRTALVNERTRAQNRLRDLLHQLDPDLAAAIPSSGLAKFVHLDKVIATFASLDGVAAAIVVDLAQACRDHTTKVKTIEKQLTKLTEAAAGPLLAAPGSGPITTATIVAEVAGVRRFRNEAALAAFAGIAPLDASSGRNDHHRLNPFGNRRLNWAVHMVAITQLRNHPPARDYYERRRKAGNTHKVAIRALKRLIIREIYKIMKDATTRSSAALTTATT